MLQWMGGSRRKVTASRKSTQKRQKKYFEQRRRQQQLQQQDSVDSSYFEGNKTCSRHADNNRSLDILSLINLSTAAQEQNSGCFLGAGDNPVDDSVSYSSIPFSPMVPTADVIPPEPTGIEEPRTSTGYSIGTAFAKTRSVKALDRHEEASNTADEKMNMLKLPHHQKLSVVDMLCNDEPTCSVDQIPEREAHVAFSIEGLGKVETETPVHSPEAPSRTFFKSSSLPLKVTQSLLSFEDLNSELPNREFESGTMMQSADAFLDRCSMRPFSSRDNMNFSKPNKRLLFFDEFSLFNHRDNDFGDLLGGDKLYSSSNEMRNNIWDASDYPTGHKLADRGFDFSDKIWMDEMDASNDFLYSTDSRKNSRTFEGCQRQNDRSTMKKACKFEPTGSAPDLKYQKAAFQNIGFSDVIWDSGAGRRHELGDLNYQPGSCFTSEHTRETESLLSEESCSSTAVSGINKATTLNSEGRHTMNCHMNIRGSECISSEKKISANLRSFQPLQEESMNGQEDITMISSPLNSGSFPYSKAASAKRVKPGSTSFFDAEHKPVETSEGFESNCKSSGPINLVPSSSNLWLDDMFGSSGNFKFSEGSSSERLGMPNLPQKSEMGQRQSKMLHIHDDLVNEDESIGGDGDQNPVNSSIDSLSINVPQREILSWNKSSSSEEGKSTAASESVLKHSNSEGSLKGTLENRNNVTEVCSLKGMEKNLPILQTPVVLNDKQDDMCGKFRQQGLTSPLIRTELLGLGAEDSGPRQGTSSTGGKNSSSPCQLIAMSYNIFAFRF